MANNLSALMAQQFEAAKHAIVNDVPLIVKIEALKHFDESFTNQGFTDVALSKWKPRKPTKKDTGRAILIKSGKMRGSIKGLAMPGMVRITSRLPYTGVHNDGLRAGRGKGFMMPKRQFIGPSKKLDDKIEDKIGRRLQLIFTRR